MLDRYDKAILNLLLKYRDSELSTYFIATKINASARTVSKHLDKLLNLGYVLYNRVGKPRNYLYTRGGKRKEISAPPKIMWRLRYKQ